MNGGLASISFANLHQPLKTLKSLPKVRNFDRIMVTEQIFWLQISVEKILLVHVGQPLQRLIHDVADKILRKELLPLFHQLVHI